MATTVTAKPNQLSQPPQPSRQGTGRGTRGATPWDRRIRRDGKHRSRHELRGIRRPVVVQRQIQFTARRYAIFDRRAIPAS